MAGNVAGAGLHEIAIGLVAGAGLLVKLPRLSQSFSISLRARWQSWIARWHRASRCSIGAARARTLALRWPPIAID